MSATSLQPEAWKLFSQRLDKIVQNHADENNQDGQNSHGFDDDEDIDRMEAIEDRKMLPALIGRRLLLCAHWVAGNDISLRNGRGKENVAAAQLPYGMNGLFRCILYK